MTCVELRNGHSDALFVFGGAGGLADELAPLARTLRSTRPVVAVLPFRALGSPDDPQTVEAMAALAVAVIRRHQARGPYWLLGYSFGGLVALEAARLLRESGEVVRFVGLVDVVYDRQHWPTHLFLAATANRTWRHLSELIRRPPPRPFTELWTRAGRLGRRLRSRVAPATTSSPGPAHDREAANFAALARWQPRRIGGGAVLFTTGGKADFGCDPAALWRPWIEGLDVRRVPGSHFSVVRDDEAIADLAKAVDDALEQAEAPPLRVLLATTFKWEISGRLAVELAHAGITVDAVGPPASILHRIPQVRHAYRLSTVRPLTSLRRAITASAADLIVPHDDQTLRALRQIYTQADETTPEGARLRERIERSLGRPESFARLSSRVEMMKVADESGVRHPLTTRVGTLAEVVRWLEQQETPLVIKTDGSWGGREVAVIRDAGEAAVAWKRLSRPAAVARIIKRLVIDRDPWPLRARLGRQEPIVSVQAYVEGRPGNVAAACLDGELLGAVQAEVLRSNGDLGPSTVVRIIDHPEMLATAKVMVQTLGISGFCGFDFVLEEDTGRAFLIEINARATPTCHLVAADGTDLLASLRTATGHVGPCARTDRYPDGVVALFPQELHRDPTSTFLASGYHDVPTHAPEFVDYALGRHGAWGRLRRRAGAANWREVLVAPNAESAPR